jgi:murein tripeptide amidase MpaA
MLRRAASAVLTIVLAAQVALAAPPRPPARSRTTTKPAPVPRDTTPAPPRDTALAPLPMQPVEEVPYFWRTRAERTEFKQTNTYQEMADALKRLEAASPFVRVTTYGRSGQGRDLLLVVAAKDRAFTPEAARASGRPVVLVQCGIHAGEIEGKDAMFALLRDVALNHRQAALLDRCILLVVPMFSPDAHERRSPYGRINQNGPAEMGWRTSPIGLNLNRDYVKAESPEMRAFLANVFTRWWPDLFVDTHTTDGVDCRYDVTYGINHGPEDPEPLNRWLAAAFEGRVVPACERMGHLVAPYIYLKDWSNPFSGILGGDNEPRFSTGYTPIQARPGILIETHMLKPYEVRVRATYDLVSAILAEVAARPKQLRDAVAAAEQGIVLRGLERDPARRRVALDSELTADSTMFPFKGFRATWEPSDITGTAVIRYSTVPLDTLIPRWSTLVASLTVTQPVGYLVPREWARVPELLDLHAVRYRRFATAWTDTVEQDRVVAWSAAAEAREGHHALSITRTEPVRRVRAWGPGDIWVPLDQRAGLVAVNLLEARAPDGLARWNFFDTVLEKKEYGEAYVVEPLARRMMQQDPDLARRFRERLASDSAFAADPFARLEFFYRRSPWADPEQDLLPVARALRAPPEAALAR